MSDGDDERVKGSGHAVPEIDHPQIRDAMSRWETIASAEFAEWDAAPLRDALVRQVLPALARSGAARVRLLDDPVRWSTEVLGRLVMFVSEQIGFLVPQTYNNNLVGLIRDVGGDYKDPNVRGHNTSAELAFHSDRSDVNALFYVRNADEGGNVCVLSYSDVADALARTCPESFDLLFRGFPFDLRDERIFPSERWYVRPILWRSQGGLRGHYIRRFIQDSQRYPDCPRLRPEQVSALDDLDRILGELRAVHAFRPAPGELVLLDNYRVMHARDQFLDRSGRGRLVIRTWIAPYQSEPLPAFLLPIAGALAPGCFRGGVGQGHAYLERLGTSTHPDKLHQTG